MYNRYPNVYVNTVILNGSLENGSAVPIINELHIVAGSSFLSNTLFLPTTTEKKHAIKRPAKYIIPLRS
jgi:hypothetical protein